ncbi:hypothetical protein ACOMHN_029911 [Nucella lapillus]
MFFSRFIIIFFSTHFFHIAVIPFIAIVIFSPSLHSFTFILSCFYLCGSIPSTPPLFSAHPPYSSAFTPAFFFSAPVYLFSISSLFTRRLHGSLFLSFNEIILSQIRFIFRSPSIPFSLSFKPPILPS